MQDRIENLAPEKEVTLLARAVLIATTVVTLFGIVAGNVDFAAIPAFGLTMTAFASIVNPYGWMGWMGRNKVAFRTMLFGFFLLSMALVPYVVVVKY